MVKTKKGEKFVGKNILILNSGSEKNKYIVETIKKLGLKTVMLNSKLNWCKNLVDDFIVMDNYNHAKVLAALREYLPNHKIDGVISFMEEDLELQAKICAQYGFTGNSLETARLCRNKYAMRQQFSGYGVLQPKFSLVTNTNELNKAIKEIGFPAVIKPIAGVGNQYVLYVENKEEAKDAFDLISHNATPKSDRIFNYNQYQFLYEAYLKGPELSVEAVTQNGQTNIIAVLDKETENEPYFLDSRLSLPSTLDEDDLEVIERTVLAAHRALGITNGISHTELCFTDKGASIIEINGRLGGNYIWDGVKTVWGVDLVEQATRVSLKMPITVHNRFIQPKKYWACDFFNAKKSGIISNITGLKEARETEGIKKIIWNKQVGDAALCPPYGFESLGLVVGQSNNHAQTKKSIDEALREIAIQTMPFDAESSVGLSDRKDLASSAYVVRKKLLAMSKVEKLKHLDIREIRRLHIGVLGNIYRQNLKTDETNEVAGELMSMGTEIYKILRKLGYKVSFFDMNKSRLPIEDMKHSQIDLMFNVCERINDSSLLEPHGASLLDVLQIPYTGSNPLTLVFCIDKIKVKKLLSYHNIPTAKFDVVYSLDEEVDPNLRYPLIVKPANTDNSIGITNRSVVENKTRLREQLHEVIIGAGRPALVEEYIAGDEYDVSIIGNGDDLEVLPLSRSIFDKLPAGYWHIYPFESKFSDNPIYDKIRTERPAKISKKLDKLITEMAIDTYNILGAHDYARVEIKVDRQNNPYVIELNPNPSIGSDAVTPKCAKLAKYDYGQFLERLLSSAVLRYKNKPSYSHLVI
ncbi:MAG: hypothetical protein COU31_02775 [Candidatus Magasanikbacteria bacterium CG10_big_fil_rev_8_21_14_0_10_40_10]|uniref:ATP-grasp domain-containing protein n=1 Tax=Candidatus Magasanikbacteria bacterium CG10_big_fil_rev_8_21_14_0_10_40_10 TaxID=1974648 RepID=A0A2M6W3U3_9BACT|nr:MAG: hypothetical protein COU31_02775 [Candidatus Magasanikbacteria bacterium CG10_big_fil_rev_8_21_14_0_10_40_10]